MSAGTILLLRDRLLKRQLFDCMALRIGPQPVARLADSCVSIPLKLMTGDRSFNVGTLLNAPRNWPSEPFGASASAILRRVGPHGPK
jgi:hypothetical protein